MNNRPPLKEVVYAMLVLSPLMLGVQIGFLSLYRHDTGVLGELLRREPLTAAGIVVTDREPDPIGGNWCWLRQREGLAETGACLPVDLFAILDGEHERAGADWAEMIGHHDEWVIYPTADAARLALGEALYRLHCPKSEVTT